jgi:hypothetical protein
MHAIVSSRRDVVAAMPRRAAGRIRFCGTDFNPARSDADFLSEFEPDVKLNITTLLDVPEALEQAVGRRVDRVDRQALDESASYRRRRPVLQVPQPVYVAG